MTERVILELSDDTLRRAREVARRTDRSVESVLSEWLERASVAPDIFPLSPEATYHIYTALGADATAQSLLDMLQVSEEQL